VAERPHATSPGSQPDRHVPTGAAGSLPDSGGDISLGQRAVSPGAVCLLDAEGRCLAADSGAAEVLGQPTGSLVGRLLQEMLPPQSVGAHPTLLTDSSCSGRAVADCTDSAGSRRRVTVCSLGDAGDAGERFVLLVDDVAEQELTQQALRESEAMAGALLNAPSDAVFMIGRDDSVLAINHVAAERLGKQAEGLVGRPASEVFTTELTPETHSLIREVLRTGLPQRFEDERNGCVFDNLLYPIANDDGSVIGCAVYARDVTQKRRSEESARRRTLELSSLLETSRALASSTLDYERVVEVATRLAAKALDVPQCSLWEFDEAGQQLVFRRLFEQTPEPELARRMEGLCLPTSDYPHEAADFHSGRPLQRMLGDDDVPPGLDEHMRLFGRRSCLLVPLMLKDEVLGGLVLVETTRERRFTPEEIALAQGLAEQITAAMANARLHRTIERQAITDGLTGLCNHRHFYARLEEEVARAARYRYSVAVLMIDLDNFKELNDACGHPAGDDVLRSVAALLAGSIRQGADLVARYGGDEFAVLLPNSRAESDADHDGAAATAERIRRAVDQIPVSVPDVRLTASVGVAVYPDTAADVRELVRQADEALYQAKSGGADRVIVYGAGGAHRSAARAAGAALLASPR
jgi:diguanylate cyclase (GGDEF)-like protein/PAS domain S-box-containing protein